VDVSHHVNHRNFISFSLIILSHQHTPNIARTQVELAESETSTLMRKAQEAEEIIRRIREEKTQNDMEKRQLEAKAQQAQQLAAQMQADALKRKNEGTCARVCAHVSVTLAYCCFYSWLNAL
jgi:hypothetical protein